MDPLRAPFVAHLDGAFRYYCSVDCHALRFESAASPGALEGDGSALEGLPPPSIDRPSIEEVADMLGLRRDSLPSGLRASDPGLPTDSGHVTSSDPSAGTRLAPPALSTTHTRWTVLVGVSATVLAAIVGRIVVLSAMGRFAFVAFFALIALAAAVAAVATQRHASEGFIPWASSMVGPIALAVSAARGTDPRTLSADLFAASAMSASVTFTVWLSQSRREQSRNALSALANAIPATARLLRNGSVETVQTSVVRAGEEVQVDAGERVPVDGVVRMSDGARVCHLGGEERSCPQGVPVLAGARVVSGSLRVLATRAGDDVALARMQRLGDAMPGSVPRTLSRGDVVALLIPWFAAAIGVLGAVLHSFAGGEESMRIVWLALAAAPPAIGASLARVAYEDAVRRAAERGIVFRDNAAVESAAAVRSVVLCTRGTVTRGEPELVDVVSLGAFSERELLTRAASAEDASREDPIARAVLAAARARGIAIEPARRPTVVAGRGIVAVSASGEPIVVGSRRVLLDESIGMASAEDVARMIEYQGRTSVFIAIDGRVEGVLGFDDPLREEARPAAQTLIDAGFELLLLAGMGRGTLESISERLDVTNVRPEVLPEERAAAVNAIREVSQRVAVIGRPPRDSAALGVATIAISLAAAGAAVGETSVAMAGDDLRDAASALSIARDGRERAVKILVAATGGALVASLMTAMIPAVGAIGAALAATVVSAGAWLASR